MFVIKVCTVEFQPGADMSWQSWAANELNQAATQPSPYGNVHKSTIATIGGSIGHSASDTWQPYNMKIRQKHIEQVNKYLATLPASTTKENRHARKFQYMAENGIRQLGYPRIGYFADRLRPEPMHCEINAWQHYLDLVYLQAVQRNRFDDFIAVLEAPVCIETSVSEKSASNARSLPESPIRTECAIIGAGERARQQRMLQESEINLKTQLHEFNVNTIISSTAIEGCGHKFVSSKIREHYQDEGKRYNKLPVRLIGKQAIALA